MDQYLGTNVSGKAIEICKQSYRMDKSKSFLVYKPKSTENQRIIKRVRANLCISLDIILHLVEDKIYMNYMQDLFSSSDKYVLIFSPDFEKRLSEHVRYRKFTPYVEKEFKEWKLIDHIVSPLKGKETIADFYLYKRNLEEKRI